MLDQRIRKSMFRHLHREIEAAAQGVVEGMLRPSESTTTSYPPNGGLTPEESFTLGRLELDDAGRAGFRKLVANAIGETLFSFFSVLDGVAEPDDFRGEWPCLTIATVSEDEDPEFLHDELLESYWDWQAVRRDPGWKLDNAP